MPIAMKTIMLSPGDRISVLGQGAWHIAEDDLAQPGQVAAR
jgi:hypothetical protein